jgi:hypothetical protein
MNMKKYLAAVGIVAAFAQPALAITFPSLTTIYVGTGVRDDGGAADAGTATSFHCTNVSGATASLRFLVLNFNGTAVGNVTVFVGHGQTTTHSTHLTASYIDGNLSTGPVIQGGINIESDQSGVFCSAVTISASATFPDGVPLRLVRINPHPGTVE